MKNLVLPILFILLPFGFIGCHETRTEEVEVLIIGGGASGVTAGIQASRMGVKTLIVEETDWLGGMLTSAGVSAIDGNNQLPSGLWGEFREKLIDYYGSKEALSTGWVSHVQFEPSVGNRILHEMVAKEPTLTVWKNCSLESLDYSTNWTATIYDNKGKRKKVSAQVVIDATELGDIAKLCDVPYDIGMESRYDTHEDVAPETANGIIQDITYVAILKDYGRDVTIAEPEGYNPQEFACACENELCISPDEGDAVWSSEMMLTYGKLPNDKYMINWPIQGNDYYVNLLEMSSEERAVALEKAKQYTLCFVYFIQHHLGYNTLGLADDEYATDDLFPLIAYHRESRRIHGQVRFTLNHVSDPYNQPEKLYRTCIAVGDYPVDHHHKRYRGEEELPNLSFHPIPSFGLPLGTLIPKDKDGLIVAEKSISVSNIINGSTRLQPVVLQIGQASGCLAALSVLQNKEIKNVTIRDVQNELLNANGYLLPYLDVPVGDPLFKTLQRIGSTGILKGEGRNVGWSNETWFRAADLLLVSEIDGIEDVYPGSLLLLKSKNTLSIGETIGWINQVKEIVGNNSISITIEDIQKLWKEMGWIAPIPEKPITRGEMALVLDRILDPFNTKYIDITGNYLP